MRILATRFTGVGASEMRVSNTSLPPMHSDALGAYFFIMLKHHKFQIEWIDYVQTRFKTKSVYMIDDVYIGASNHTRQRILQHCNDAINNRHINKKLQEHLLHKIISNAPIKVYCLSSFPYLEAKYIEQYKPKFNISAITLTNRLK